MTRQGHEPGNWRGHKHRGMLVRHHPMRQVRGVQPAWVYYCTGDTCPDESSKPRASNQCQQQTNVTSTQHHVRSGALEKGEWAGRLLKTSNEREPMSAQRVCGGYWRQRGGLLPLPPYYDPAAFMCKPGPRAGRGPQGKPPGRNRATEGAGKLRPPPTQCAGGGAGFREWQAPPKGRRVAP